VINLFEYENKEVLPDDIEGLEDFLDDIWNSREKSSYWQDGKDEKIESQRFLQFLHHTKQIKSNKYVGVIHYEGHKINLLPKIFYEEGREYSEKEVAQMHNHVLWWLSYCRKIKFPKYQAALGSLKSDFFEVLIYLFSKYTRELLSNSIYQQYEEISRELTYIKGRLDVNEYINRNLSNGRWHKLNCTYDSFEYDNKFNRIIKHVAGMLFQVTKSPENKKFLREILFILDEVSDQRATAEECGRIQFNPMFEDFETVRDYCYLFLSNSVSFDYKNDLKLFAFLLPMEYVFEDFIFGFIDKELDSVRAKSQASSTYLDQQEKFLLKPDLILNVKSKRKIADAKYKVVYSDEKDSKKKISQSDLYQMLAYGVRFNIDEIILFYPNTIGGESDYYNEIIIEDMLAGNKKILIEAFQLPILNESILSRDIDQSQNLEKMFEKTKDGLKIRIQGILLEERMTI
jgi:5-methylcytosine-specific restriction enzyme subunit McrC